MVSEQLPRDIEVDGKTYAIKFNTGNENFDYEITAPNLPECFAINEDLDVALEEIKTSIRECRASAES